MDLQITSDQELFREATAKFLESACPIEKLRALADDATGVDDGYLAQGAELGWFAMLVPEEHGGGSVSGDGLLDAAIIAEERGRLLQPGPFTPANVCAFAVADAGRDAQKADLLPALAAGEAIATPTLTDGNVTICGEAEGDGFTISGTAPLVQDAHLATWFLVTAATANGLTQFVVPAATPGVTVTPLESLDLSRKFGEVTFADVALSADAVLGTPDGAAAAVQRQTDVAVVLTVADMIGAMNELFERTVEYAKARTAFGRPIGSFQSIKHLLADVSLRLEASKAIAVAAQRAVQTNAEGASETASMAKSFVGDAAHDLAQNCFQVHGGIGYTWEHDLHLFMRRLTTDKVLYGSPEFHRERLCSLQGM
ncbi:MAG: acyl-CoA dehydrogenase family protein [Acidimicrobiia bacterium]